MSFTGAGPLGSKWWGTSTADALVHQAHEVQRKYAAARSAIDSPQDKDVPAPAPFPFLNSVCQEGSNILDLPAHEAQVWAAAVFTASEVENLPSEKRYLMAMRKKEFSDQPQDIVDATEKFRSEALQSLTKRHAAIEALPATQRNVLYKVADWITSVVVNVRLREMLCYPLIRDQLEGGQAFYDASLDTNDHLREILKNTRRTIYDNAGSTAWYGKVGEAQGIWEKSWEQENKQWVPKLTEYLRLHAQSSNMRDICASKEHPGIEEPNPPTNHDLNYGQQLSQMYEIIFLYAAKTGNLQGIYRPRHEADWSCTDGYEPAYRPVYDSVDGIKGTPPKATGKGEREVIDYPQPKEELKKDLPLGDNKLPYIGSSLGRIVAHPDAQTKEIREQTTEFNEKRSKDTIESVKQAHLAYYGSEMAEQVADQAHLAQVAGERAASLQEYLRGEPHTTDLEGSYYWNEVQLAFRNHGIHWESIGEDITPLGSHYLLIHYDVQFFKKQLENYRLKVYGCVKNPVELTYEQVREIGKAHTFTMPMIMECSGNGRAMMKPRYNQHVPWGLQAFGCYCWTGMPLRVILNRVQPTVDCIDVIFTGYDAGLEKEKEIRYFQHSINIHDPVIDHSWLCWMNNGVDLLPEHGYPLRLMVPAWYGNINIKWLKSIEFVPRKFKGVYQRTYSYSKTPSDNDVAVPSQELRPRAMFKPIGYPDFTTRKRTALAGQQTFHGKCWVGGGHYRAIIHVELSLDGGASWLPCKLEPRIGIFAWGNWSLTVDLPVGLYKVVVRATDCVGQRQQMKLDWNWASMQDDAMQIQDLTVVDYLGVTE